MAAPEPDPETLAAGELVWAKTRPRQPWWPATLRAAAPANSKDAPVSLFADPDAHPDRAAARIARFADPAADRMARAGATARGFVKAVELAHAAAVALLCAGLTCACAAPPPPPAAEGAAVVVAPGLDNLSPSEFLASLRQAALDAPAVGLLDRARLTSWARALARGWGPARYPRRSLDDLVDKIDLDDLNEPAGDALDDAGDDADAAADEDSDKAAPESPPPKTPAQRKRRGRPRKEKKEDAALTEDSDAGEEPEEDQKSESDAPPEAALSTGRTRKKSKYLSPPYCYLSSSVLDEKLADLPPESPPSAAKEEKKVLRDNVDVGEVLDLVGSLGVGFFHETQLPKATERFLGLLRSSTFAGVDAAALVSDPSAALKLGKSVLERSRKKDEVGVGSSSTKSKKKSENASPTATLDFPAQNAAAEDGADVAGLVSDSGAAVDKAKGVRKRGRKKGLDASGGSSVKRAKTSPKDAPELPAENASANAGVDVAGLVPHSGAAVGQEKGVSKRGRKKKDQDGSGASSIKRKTMKKTSPTAIVDSGLVITPAIPIRQLGAQELISQVRSGGGAGMGVGVLDQNKLEFGTPVPAAMSGGMKPGDEHDQADGGSVVKTPVTVKATILEADMNVESVAADLPAKSVQAEETKPAMDIQVDMNVQVGITDVPMRSVLMEAMEVETNIPLDTKEQGALTDLPVPSGLLPKDGGISQPADGNANNAYVEVSAVQESYASMVPEIYTGTNIIATNHAFKAEGQKGELRTTGEVIVNHSPAISTNGNYCDALNSTPKRRNKNVPQCFPNPVEIVLQFTDGVVLPSKEQLLSTFSKFGVLIESLSDILVDIRGARVVFGKSAEADAVYAKRETTGIFGQFGPPYATLMLLNYLPPFTPSIPSPALKPPLDDAVMKKNLENMISSLAGQAAATSSSAGATRRPPHLLGEMQRLLSKINNKQAGPASSASAPQ